MQLKFDFSRNLLEFRTSEVDFLLFQSILLLSSVHLTIQAVCNDLVETEPQPPTCLDDCAMRRYFLDRDGLCKMCEQCMPGFQHDKYCGDGKNGDARCIACPPDHFSLNPYDCLACRVCENTEIVHECSASHDRECGTCLYGFYKDPQNPDFCNQKCEWALAPQGIPECQDWWFDNYILSYTTTAPGPITNQDEDAAPSRTIRIVVITVLFIAIMAGTIVPAFLCCRYKWNKTPCPDPEQPPGTLPVYDGSMDGEQGHEKEEEEAEEEEEKDRSKDVLTPLLGDGNQGVSMNVLVRNSSEGEWPSQDPVPLEVQQSPTCSLDQISIPSPNLTGGCSSDTFNVRNRPSGKDVNPSVNEDVSISDQEDAFADGLKKGSEMKKDSGGGVGWRDRGQPVLGMTTAERNPGGAIVGEDETDDPGDQALSANAGHGDVPPLSNSDESELAQEACNRAQTKDQQDPQAPVQEPNEQMFSAYAGLGEVPPKRNKDKSELRGKAGARGQTKDQDLQAPVQEPNEQMFSANAGLAEVPPRSNKDKSELGGKAGATGQTEDQGPQEPVLVSGEGQTGAEETDGQQARTDEGFCPEGATGGNESQVEQKNADSKIDKGTNCKLKEKKKKKRRKKPSVVFHIGTVNRLYTGDHKEYHINHDAEGSNVSNPALHLRGAGFEDSSEDASEDSNEEDDQSYKESNGDESEEESEENGPK